MTVCFDTDGCLIDKSGNPIEENLQLLLALSKSHKVFVWSGNGWQYAYDFAKKLGIVPHIHGVLNKYNTFKPDIAFDDQEIDLGKVNIWMK